MLTQTTYNRPTLSAETSDTEIQTKSRRNQSHSTHEIRENSTERYEDSSDIRQPTVHFEPATQLPENHTTNSPNEHFRNLYFSPNQRNPHKNGHLPKINLKTFNGDPLKWHSNGIVISNQQYMIMCHFRTHRKSAISHRSRKGKRFLVTHKMDKFTTMQ